MTDFRYKLQRLVDAVDSKNAMYLQVVMDETKDALATEPMGGVTDFYDLVHEIRDNPDDFKDYEDYKDGWKDACNVVMDLIWRTNSTPPQAVAMGERLPGPISLEENGYPSREQCGAEGWAWVFDGEDWTRLGWGNMNWEYWRHHGYTHWLPAAALPLPVIEPTKPWKRISEVELQKGTEEHVKPGTIEEAAFRLGTRWAEIQSRKLNQDPYMN